MTPSGIEPATFRFVAQHLNHCAIAVPIILNYFYSKTNQVHNISNLFYFRTTLYMFRTVCQSIIRSLRLYVQHQVSGMSYRYVE